MNIFFEWDKDFETGNKVIDKQHYGLVQLINELMKVELTDEQESIEKLSVMSQKLSEYVIIHFNSEEEIMKQYAVDLRHAENHKKIHQDFINKVNEYSKNTSWFLDRKKIEEIIEYLIRWLAYHILHTDKSLFRQVDNIIQNKLTPAEAYDKEEQINELSTEPLLKALKALYVLISDKNRELERKNNDLEKIVEERTNQLIEANKKLETLSLVDELTGLYNRRFVLAEIEQLIYKWEHYKTQFSVIYLDADKFKSVNDIHGHDKGDLVLRWIADYLRSNVRKTDHVCRFGGDEFVIICVHYNSLDLKRLGEKLLKGYKEDNEEVRNIQEYWKPSLSIGIATVDKTIKSPEDILKKADDTMYNSKKAGGNQVHCADVINI